MYEQLVAGVTDKTEKVYRKEFICQNGWHYGRKRAGSGKDRKKELGGYEYAGAIGGLATNPEWEGYALGYATITHNCKHGRKDMGFVSGKGESPSGTDQHVSRLPLSWDEIRNLPVPPKGS